MRNVRLEFLSLEERRAITDELTLSKIFSNRIKTTLNNQISLRTGTRFIRQNNVFYLPHVTTNVEYFSPMLRLQRQHDEIFFDNDSNEASFNAFKRYTIHGMKLKCLFFNYTFN